MKRFILCVLLAALLLAVPAHSQVKSTHLFAERDTCNLYLDLYMPSDEAILAEGKPVILFAFGGGFITGRRDDASYLPWFKDLTSKGYPVVSIDYRLGLKGARYGVNLKFAKALKHAIGIATEDFVSATGFLLENAAELGIAGRPIVAAGSSAGAVTVLQAEYCISNSLAPAETLPQDFNYAGVMSFSGAIFSSDGSVKYRKAPCPQLLFHGTADKLVPYKQIHLFKMCFGGTFHIARALEKEGRNYQVWRFKDRQHEVASSMLHNLPIEYDFLERNVTGGEFRVIDATIQDSNLPMPKWATAPAESIY